jgi:hypothetical protein
MGEVLNFRPAGSGDGGSGNEGGGAGQGGNGNGNSNGNGQGANGRKRAAGKSGGVNASRAKVRPDGRVDAPAPPNRGAVQLWQLSHGIDDLVRDAILQKQASVDEVAAVLAHRLGTLIATSDKAAALSDFCCQLIRRLNPGSDTGPAAG